MSPSQYDFLLDSFLFDPKHVRARYSSFSDLELEDELGRYRLFCMELARKAVEGSKQGDSSLRLFAGEGPVPIQHLKENALYVETFVVDDPVFRVWRPRTAERERANLALGGTSGSVDREELAKQILYLGDLSPMVAGGYVELMPISSYFEPPDPIPLTSSPNLFADALPRETMDFLQAHVKVRSMKKTPRGLALLDHLEESEWICVSFEGADLKCGQLFRLQNNSVTSVDEENRTVEFVMEPLEARPDELLFKELGSTVEEPGGHEILRQRFAECLSWAQFWE